MRIHQLGLLVLMQIFVLGACVSIQSERPVDVDVAQVERSLTDIGVQLYTVRSELAQDFEGTLERIAEMGYTQVEFAGLYKREPEDVKALLDELGLDAISMHVQLSSIRNDPDGLIEDAEALSAEFIVLPFLPALFGQNDPTKWNDWIDTMNSFGRKASKHGLSFAYHNHAFEFEPIDGVSLYDAMFERIDREHVQFELDLYWVAKAGYDPRQYFDAYPGGFPLLHVKDMGGVQNEIVDVGDGVIDFAEIFKLNEVSGARYFIVEHDNSDDPMATLERSIQHLQTLRF
ncbi:MAG: sugar phosphate isomerase/epimerase [Pseudomonadota bacterium]